MSGTVMELNDANEQNSEDKQSTPVLRLLLQVVICCLILIGNSLILVVIRKNNKMALVTRYLIANLAVSDLCFGAALGLRFFILLINPQSLIPCRIVVSAGVASGVASIAGIALLCCQTFFAVTRLTLDKTLKLSVVKILIAGSWLVCGIIGGLTVVFSDTEAMLRDKAYNAPCVLGSRYHDPKYMAFIAGCILLVTTMVVFFQLMAVCKHLKHQRRIALSVQAQTRAGQCPGPTGLGKQNSSTAERSEPELKNDATAPTVGRSSIPRTPTVWTSQGTTDHAATSSSKEPTNSSQATNKANYRNKRKNTDRNNRRLLVIVSCVLVVFVLSWVPFMLALFLNALCSDHCGVNTDILSGLSTLLSIQSFANFLLYVVKDKEFQIRLKSIFSCA